MTKHRETYVRPPIFDGTPFERAHTALTLGVIAASTLVMICGFLPR